MYGFSIHVSGFLVVSGHKEQVGWGTLNQWATLHFSGFSPQPLLAPWKQCD